MWLIKTVPPPRMPCSLEPSSVLRALTIRSSVIFQQLLVYTVTTWIQRHWEEIEVQLRGCCGAR
jgi:hypothetical protein